MNEDEEILSPDVMAQLQARVAAITVTWEHFLTQMPPLPRPETEGNIITDFLEPIPDDTLLINPSSLVNSIGSKGEPQKLRISHQKIKLYCSNSECEGIRHFELMEARSRNKAMVEVTSSNFYQDFTLNYRCCNCQKTTKRYYLRLKPTLSNQTGFGVKIGELPPYSPPVPARVITLIGRDRELFLIGRKAENMGFGIGAFAYYRRVIENQKGHLIKEISKVAKRLGATEAELATYQKAEKETQFSKAIEMVKDVMPRQLLIRGNNPLALLHSALSEGLHDRSDADCLELAHSIRILLTKLADNINEVMKEETELEEAIAALNKFKNPAQKNT
jgi:hypothetical protein